MNRKTAIATAGAVTLTVAAGAVAIAANVGVLGATRPRGPGIVKPANAVVAATTEAKPEIVTVYVDGPPGSKPATKTVVVEETQTPEPVESVSPSGSNGDEISSDDSQEPEQENEAD